MSVIAAVVFVLAFPYSLFEQPIVVQVFLSIAAFVALLAPVLNGLTVSVRNKVPFTVNLDLVAIANLFVTPLLILCLLLGNVRKLALVIAAGAAPLVLLGR